MIKRTRRASTRLWRCLVRGLVLVAIATSGCGGTAQSDLSDGSSGDGDSGDGDSGDGDSGDGDVAIENGIEFTYESLDVSSLGKQSENWCQPPEFSPAGFIALDQATFADLMSQYIKGWMAPLHESLLGLDERNLFNAFFEVMLAAYRTDCNWNQPEDLEGLPPDNELLDPDNQNDVVTEVSAYLNSGTELSSGEELRLAMLDCEPCEEPLGTEPYIIKAKLTEDGVLVMQLELSEAVPWTQTLVMTPDALVLQAPLEDLSEWLSTSTQDTRSGEVIVPRFGGTVTFVARKDNAGGISTTVGISEFALEAQPGSSDNFFVATGAPCMGMHAGISAPDQAAQLAGYLGDLSASVPGHLHCDEDECGEKERNNDWTYTLGDLAFVAEQPDLSSEKELELYVRTTRASTAQVGGDVFASGGPGAQGQGGEIALNVDVTEPGYVVTFEPALSLGGAMMISNFSEEMRLELPTWLQDEIFDVTFGGSPRASVFVPVRQLCPEDGPDPPEPLRRPVEIREGTFSLTSGQGTETVAAGQCIGASLENESTYALTSDWWELGISCE